jgi:hypothetical protein
MASYGLFHIKDKVAVRFTVFCIVIFSLVIAVFAYRPFLMKNSAVNLKDAGEFLDGLEEPNVMVFSPLPEDPVVNPAVAVPLLDLYTKKNIIYDYNAEDYRQPRSEIETSALRFSWEYRNPDYYAGKDYTPADTAIAVISEDTDKPLPKHVMEFLRGYHEVKKFSTYEGTFSFRTNVRVYQADNQRADKLYLSTH